MSFKKSILFGLSAAWTFHVTAQNVPNGTTIPQGSAQPVTLPASYSSFPNTAPTLFNYTRTYTPRIPTTNTTGMSLLGAPTSTQIVTTYTNGFGEAVQQSIRRGSASVGPAADIVSVYDVRKQLSKIDLLPYIAPVNSKFQTNAYVDQRNYYNTNFLDEDAISYSEQRILSGASTKSFQPGKSGNLHPVTQSVDLPGNSILIWDLDASGNPVHNSSYPSNQLTSKTTQGEHDALTIEYYNKQGQLLCKRTQTNASNSQYATTYYVYNDFGGIAYIITPKAVEAMGQGQLTPQVKYKLCYSYKYNSKGQVIEKQIPGQQVTEHTLYDKKDRPVLYQSSADFFSNRWQFTLYDVRGRVAMTGLLSSTDNWQTWQQAVNGTSNPTPGTLLYNIQNEFTNNYYPNSFIDCDVLVCNYYDTYDTHPDLAARTFSTAYTSDYVTTSEAITPVYFGYPQGLLTGKRVKVIGDPRHGMNEWVNTVFFYNHQGQIVQKHEQNPWNTTGWDINTYQYDFSGNLINSISDIQAWPAANKPATKLIMRRAFSLTSGLLTSVTQKIDNGPWTTVANYNYNKLRQVSTKVLGGVETQVVDYRIDGKVAAMNREYVNNQSSTQSSTFGYILNHDYGFSKPHYDGAISGFIWRGAGSASTKKAYGYQYDAAGRLNGADFREYSDPSIPANIPYTPYWNNDRKDYSVSNISYDANGNILAMKQRGVGLVGGTATPVDMDDLSYIYKPFSNTLDYVSDAVGTDYNLHDFLDGHPGTSTEYYYDGNGNLSRDLNKNVSEITYNHLNLPLTVTTSTGTITYDYDGEGRLLQKGVTSTMAPAELTRYWGGFVYKGNALQYFLHEEGRCRWIAGNPGKFEYDYFVKDHLGNVRTVVNAEQVNMREYLASMELAAANLENLLFEHIDDVREVNPASVDPQNTKAAELNGAEPDHSVGTALLLKVMAGDKFKVKALSYYSNEEEDNNEATGPYSMLEAIVGALSGGLSGGGKGEGGTVELVNNLFSASNYVDAYNALLYSITDPEKPRAYLQYLVFDEEMRLVKEQSGAIQVGGGGNAWQVLENTELTVGQNGYLSIFVSNASHRSVYFDNVLLQHYRGKLLEEQHYYPHGLTIRGGANTPLPNKYLHQSKELQDEHNLDLYDFHARLYDPQIGRFWGLDPMDQFPSGYTGMGNDPANLVDPTGMLATGRGDLMGASNLGGGGKNWDHYSEYSNTYWGGSWEDYNPLRDIPGGGSGGGCEVCGEASAQGEEIPNGYLVNQDGSYVQVSNEGGNVTDYVTLEGGGIELPGGVKLEAEGSFYSLEVQTHLMPGEINDAALGYAARTPGHIYIGTPNPGTATFYNDPITLGGPFLLKFAAGRLTAGSSPNDGRNIFGKEIESTATRTGRNGRAVEIQFKDGSKTDINAVRVKEWAPNRHPSAPPGTLQKVRFENSIEGSKGFKRVPTQAEINYLNRLR